ncbi:DUF4349 domain-containing protein [Streptomyces sp. NPDC044571]|uniref:DUF4349 domain-containing protein n=1 Tax=Streptomyces sp. NPDC044571 TaxID=3155371 RepID=UPI003409B008
MHHTAHGHGPNHRRGAAALAALCLAGTLALTGCGAGDEAAGQSAAKDPRAAAGPAHGKPGAGPAAGSGAGAAAPPAADAAKNPQQQPALRPHVIRTATLAIETADAQKALAAARTAAEGAGGFVGSESTRRGKDGLMASTVTLRVPGERFDAVLGALEGSGRLLGRTVEAQDVTEKVTDVDSRVRSQQASVARVRDMMEKASALADVVMLENELSKRQSDLESLLAQQTALKDQTSLGTITVEVTEPAAEPEAKKDAPPSFADALRGGWHVFATLLHHLVLAVAAVLPFAVTAALAALGWRVRRRLRPARPKTGPAGPAPRRVPGARAASAAQPLPADRPADPTESEHASD